MTATATTVPGPANDAWDLALEHYREEAVAVLASHSPAAGICPRCSQQAPCDRVRCAEFVLEL